MDSPGKPPALHLDDLPADVRKVIAAAMAGDEVVVIRGRREVGFLSFRTVVPAEDAVAASRAEEAGANTPDGVTVVATGMRLSETARRRLSDALGPAYIVLDFLDAPASADVVLIHPVSPQLLGLMRSRFPRARVIITEIEDEELGISYSGPVSRLLAAGACAYLPPRPVDAMATSVHTYLTQGGRPSIDANHGETKRLPLPTSVDGLRPAAVFADRGGVGCSLAGTGVAAGEGGAGGGELLGRDDFDVGVESGEQAGDAGP